MKISTTLRNLIIIQLLCPFIQVIYAQDSLYLIGTITGESTEHRIDYPVGIGDINRDGYDDFMVRMKTGIPSHDQTVIKLYLGSTDFDLNPDMIFHYPGGDTLNYLACGHGIGDVNNDGYDDFVLSGDFGGLNFTKGKVFLFYGGQPIDTIPVAEFYQTGPDLDLFGDLVEGLGDINKDGYDDFAICSYYNWSDEKGYVYLFWGGDTISWDRSITLTSDTLSDFFGSSVANIGDINNDGFDDIAVGASNELLFVDTAKVYFYYGGDEMDNVPDYVMPGNEVINFGDTNGDGKEEFIIEDEVGVNVHYSMDSTFTLGRSFAILCSGGDFNKDGYDDFMATNNYFRNNDSVMVGATFIYRGSNSIDTVYDYMVEGENQWCGIYAASIKDINGDDYDDILIFTPGYPDNENPTGKLYIYSYIKPNEITDDQVWHPIKFQLSQNFPNPFNPSTTINYQLPKTGFVTLKIYDILGKEVATLVNEQKNKGRYSVNYDASRLASGVYIYQLRVNDYLSSKKMLLLKYH
jgi:hypothetical protein